MDAHTPEEVDAMAARVRAKFEYNANEGFLCLRNAVNSRYPAGFRVGYMSRVKYREYWIIKFEGKNQYAHKLIWLYVYGKLPASQLDHINGVKHDNRIENLRECTSAINNCNKRTPSCNTSGAKNVVHVKATGKWRVQIKASGKTHHIGMFDSFELAKLAASDARKYFHGEYVNER